MKGNLMTKVIKHLSSGKRRRAGHRVLCSLGAAAAFGMACTLLLSAGVMNPGTREPAAPEATEQNASYETESGGFVEKVYVENTGKFGSADQPEGKQLLLATIGASPVSSLEVPETIDIEADEDTIGDAEVQVQVEPVTKEEAPEDLQALEAQFLEGAEEPLMPMEVRKVTASRDGENVSLSESGIKNITVTVTPTDALIEAASGKLGMSVKMLSSNGDTSEVSFTNVEINEMKTAMEQGSEAAPLPETALTFAVPEGGDAVYYVFGALPVQSRTLTENEDWDGVWLDVHAGEEVEIDLNGFQIEQNDSKMAAFGVTVDFHRTDKDWPVRNLSLFYVAGKLTIKDSGENGKIIARKLACSIKEEIDWTLEDAVKKWDGWHGALVYVKGGGELNIEGGRLEVASGEDEGPVRVIAAEDGAADSSDVTINLSGGTVTGAKGAWGGGGIFVAKGEVNISGTARIENNSAESGGGIYASSGVKVNISGGDIEQNTASAASGQGGGVYAGEINMTGGSVRNNTSGAYGGGVYTERINMTTGTISVNTALNAGGGVYAQSMKMTGGTISQNTVGKEGYKETRGGGGGIYIAKKEGGSEFDDKEIAHRFEDATEGEVVCNMSLTGGTIENNTSYHTGGGIFVDRGSVAYISGDDSPVQIIGNKALNQSIGHGYAGGGIFVEHETKETDPQKPIKPEEAKKGAQVYLYNAVITGNTAQRGGGVAGCGISNVNICSVNGVAVYGNTAELKVDGDDTRPGASNDLYVDGSGTVDSIMMGGVQVTWSGKSKNKGGEEVDKENIVDGIEFGKGTDKNQMPFEYGFYLTASKLTQEEKETINAYATVFIQENESGSAGGGVGGNGFMKMGLKSPDLEEKYSLRLEKKVSGAAESDGSREFGFTIKLEDDEHEPVTKEMAESLTCVKGAGSDEGETVSFDKGSEDGEYKFSLENGQYIKIRDIPSGWYYTITEDAAPGYMPSFKVVAGTGEAPTKNDEVSGWIVQDNDIVFTNTAAYELPRTGGMTPDRYYMLGCALLAAAMAGGWTYKRRGN